MSLSAGGDVASGDPGEIGHAENGGAGPGGLLVDLGEFVAGPGQADLESFDLTEPSLAVRLR